MRENAGKMRTRITPNTDTLYPVSIIRNSEFKILSKKNREWKYNLRGINSQLPMTEFFCEKQLKGIGLILNYTTTQNEPKRHKASQNDQKET